MTAIVNCMKEKYYKWPSAEETKSISCWIKHQFHLHNCVGSMDGTINPPAFELQCCDASDYSGRKYGYSFNTLVVSINMQRIMYYLAEWQGRIHNNHIFKKSHLFQDFNLYSSECEYLLVDLAFKCFLFKLEHINGQGTSNRL